MMKVFGVNIVILPPTKIARMAISLSKQLGDASPIILDLHNYLPHISLAMGYVTNLPQTLNIVEKILKKFTSFNIVIEDIFESSQEFNNYYFWHLKIRKDTQLIKLHEKILDYVPFINIKNPPQEALITELKEKIAPPVFGYINEFKNKHSKDNFRPHITLGANPKRKLMKPSELPCEFAVNRIYLSQLGNYCTCRKIFV